MSTIVLSTLEIVLTVLAYVIVSDKKRVRIADVLRQFDNPEKRFEIALSMLRVV